jgi:hypothetical protein
LLPAQQVQHQQRLIVLHDPSADFLRAEIDGNGSGKNDKMVVKCCKMVIDLI